MASSGSLAASGSWNGSGISNILFGGQSLAVNESGTVSVTFTVTPGNVTSVDNLATAEGESPQGEIVTDISTDGLDPDPDGDGTPDEEIQRQRHFLKIQKLSCKESYRCNQQYGWYVYGDLRIYC